MNQMIELEIQLYTDPDTGLALGNGLVYVGVAGTDPTQEVNQIPVTLRQENGDEVATAQPVTLGAGGIPVYNGSPAQIMTTASDYALAVHDKNDVQVYYVGTRLINAAVAESAANAALTAADVVTTNADVVLTNANVVLTGLDVDATNADVVLTNADVVFTNADVVLCDQAVIDAEAAEANILALYEEGSFAADGDFTAGTIRYTRMGKMVTISWPQLLYPSAFLADMATALPASVRPSDITYNVYFVSSNYIGTVEVTSSGILTIRTFDTDGAPVLRSGTDNGSISYNLA